MCYLVCGMVHINEPLLLIRKNSPCSGGSGFPLLLSECFFTICSKIVLSALLNKTFPSLLTASDMLNDKQTQSVLLTQ